MLRGNFDTDLNSLIIVMLYISLSWIQVGQRIELYEWARELKTSSGERKPRDNRRVTDGVIRRMNNKWLKAGVLEDGLLRHATEGSPQGGVISPCLSNIFLHHVLDEWFELEVRPRLKGRCTLVSFADDAVMAFEDSLDAKRVLGVLGKRLARYGLTLHLDKTRFVDFRDNRPNGTAIRRRTVPRSPSSALPTRGASRGQARMWCGK